MFYLFDWKFGDLMFFSFLHGKTCAPEKPGTPEHALLSSGVQFVHVCYKVIDIVTAF